MQVKPATSIIWYFFWLPATAVSTGVNASWCSSGSSYHTWSCPCPWCSAAHAGGTRLCGLLWENLSSRKSTPREGWSELLLRVCLILTCSFRDNTLLFRVSRRGGLCRAVTKHFSALGRALGWSKVAGLQGWLLFLPGKPNRFTVHSNFGYIDTIALKLCLCKCLKPYSSICHLQVSISWDWWPGLC